MPAASLFARPSPSIPARPNAAILALFLPARRVPADTFVMGTLIFLLAVSGAPLDADCTPQFAPLETGTSSGASTLQFWRKAEAGDWGGTGWLGWDLKSGRALRLVSGESDRLQPVELIVRDRPKDFPDDDENVTVQAIPDVTFAVRCVRGLTAGPIQTLAPSNESLQCAGPFLLTFGARQCGIYLESARDDLSDAQVILTDGLRRQVLYSADGFIDDPHSTSCGRAISIAMANSISS